MNKSTLLTVSGMILAVGYLVLFKPGMAFECKDYSNSIVKDVCQAAYKAFPDNKIMAKLAMVQALHESGLLQGGSKLANQYNNLFGIKKACTNGVVKISTKEYIKGKNVTISASFGSCLTKEDSFKQFRQIMENTRYSKVWASASFEDAAKAVQIAGYATDPTYAKKLIKLYKSLK